MNWRYFVFGMGGAALVLGCLFFEAMAFSSGPLVYTAPSSVNINGTSRAAITAPEVTVNDGGLVFTSPTSGEAGPIYWIESSKKLTFGNSSGAFICMGTSADCTGGVTGEVGAGYASFSNYLIPGGGLMFAPLYIGASENGFMLNNNGYEFLDNTIPAAWLHEDGTTGEISLQTGMGRAGGTPSGTGYLFDSYAAYTGTIAQFSIHTTGKASIDSNGTYFKGTAPAAIVTTASVAMGIESGQKALSSGTGSVTFSPAFASGTPVCTCTDTNVSTATVVGCSANASALSLKGTGTDTINWICIGIQ